MKNTSFLIPAVAILISIIGISCIYSSTFTKEGKFWQSLFQRQIAWVILGLASFCFISNLNYRRLWDWTYLLYFLALCFLFFVFSLGVVRSGAQRWLKIAWLNFQPSDIAKLILIIFLARYFSLKSVDDIKLPSSKFGVFKGLVLPFVFTAIPMGLIIEQPDLGNGLLILASFIVMLFLTNIRLRYIFIFLMTIALAAPFLWHFLHYYQKERLLVFLNPNIDPLGAGYTIIQSKIAIGSGGFFGKGWLSGTQSQLRFLPESHTDFIFATFSEQWGFLGSLILIGLYYFLIRQGILIAERTQDAFGRLLAFGISLMLGIQIFVNIAMNLGLAPVVGLPLPLMSYGGSSVLATFIALGILVNIGKTRSVF